ncbi:MAG: type 2 lantipeptide synthetase LanM family protein [Anaerolineales bacterium]|nr:MAG: type 2 lantipeptide synthetase LanM family protein [Anaerolineales bacterium]
MAPEWFLSPAWCDALTLAERIALLSSEGAPDPLSDQDVELGRRRLQSWRSQPPFDTQSHFAQRLALENIDEESILPILGQTIEGLHRRLPHPPGWLLELAEAFAYPASGFANPPPGEEIFSFLDLIQPLVDLACDRLNAGIAALEDQWPTPPFDPQTVIDVLLMNLPDPLLTRLGRTLVLELNVARLQDVLDGETPAERFESFIHRLRQPEEAIAILAEYPVLARQLTICIAHWVEVCLEFLERLCADWEAILDCFGPAHDPGLLVELVGGAGDTHRGGRSVMIARFDSGFQMVYKPKSLAIDVHFQELLAWLNGRGCQPPLQTLKILDRGAYGWVEYVEVQACTSVAEIECFYQRLGAYLALLYTLNATDFHLENLIARGQHPMLIDLETLFNPQFDRFDGAEAGVVVEQALANSVLQVGLLPQRLWARDEYGGIDISGLGGDEGQLSPDRIPQPAHAGTDHMHYIRQRVELPGEANRPSLDGAQATALDHVEDVVKGFVMLYQLLMDHRVDLVADHGPLARFALDETRVLLRPTRTYDQLLFESFHPDVLRQGLDRDLLLDRLWTAVPGRPYMSQVIGVEQAELQQGDIPVFTTHPTSLDLTSGNGQTIRGVLTETGMALVQRRLRALDEQDKRRQEWFIRATLATLESGMHRPPAEPIYLWLEAQTSLSRDRLLAGARAVADRLAETSIRGQEDISWIGLELLAEENWGIAPLGIDLYSGIPGMALFLAYAGAVLGEEGYTTLARRALNSILRQVELLSPDMPDIGGLEGWGGVLYTLTHLGVLWAEPGLLSQAEGVVEVLAGFIGQDQEFGLVRGAAGAIGGLLAFHHCLPSQKALNAAITCGDHLIASAQPVQGGLGWTVPRLGPRPLTGFAYGAAGIAWALLELAGVSGHQRFRAAARQAIDYERALYSPQAGNWPDLREAGGPDSARRLVAWCHGAAGIGLARLRALSHLDDPKLGDEIQTAINTTLSHGFGFSHCLCHGDMGNLELLLQASQVLDDHRWHAQVERLAPMVLDSIDRHGWACGGPGAVELPGLMLGLAGIGYQMLRLAEPDRVPSVLLLAPPV